MSLSVAALVPRVHDVTVAMPLTSVSTGVPGTTTPSPLATNVTDTPAPTGLLNESVTWTDGGIVTAVATVAL